MRHWLNHLSSRAAFAALRAVVIELFSSQDCSSWPPAAALSGELGVWGAMEQYFKLMTPSSAGFARHRNVALGSRFESLSFSTLGLLKFIGVPLRRRLEVQTRDEMTF